MLKTLELTSKPKIIISKELQSEIMSLHARVGDLEWSGPLFYKIIEGSIEQPSNLVIKALHIFPCDIGSASYTEYTADETWLDFYDAYPECEPGTGIKWGHMHTHHTMATFFSGTDTQELQDNAPAHNYYLSLIVNHNSKFCAKIALKATRTIRNKSEGDSIAFKGANGAANIELVPNTTDDLVEEVLVTMDCEIEFEQTQFFKDRVAFIDANRRKPVVHVYKPYVGKSINDDLWDDQPRTNQMGLWDEYGVDYNFPKGISKPTYTETEIKSFLVKWIAGDLLSEDTLSAVLSNVDSKKRFNSDKFINSLDNRLEEFFYKIFDSKPNIDTIEDIANRAVAILEIYVPVYTITESIIDLLDLYIMEDDLEIIKNYKHANYGK